MTRFPKRVRLLLSFYRRALRLRYGPDLLDGYGREMEDAAGLLLEEGLRRRGTIGLVGAAWTLVRDLGRPMPAISTGDDPAADMSHASAAPGSFRGVVDDLGYAARSLRREPRFVALLTGVLTFGMVANVSVFSVVDAYLFEPLPYPESDRLYNVEAWGALNWSEVDDVFDLAVSWDLDVFSLVGGTGPELVRGAWITPDFMPAYGIQPALGRGFTPEEGGVGGQSVAVISHALWTSRFGADPDVLGRTFSAYTSDRPDDAESFTIVGVLPRDFWHVNAFTEVLVPLREDRAVYVGRLRDGVALEQAEATLAARAVGRLTNAPEGFRVRLHSLREQYVSAVRPTLTVVQISALLVLLIACVNGAVLLLLRAGRRASEVRVRRAVGASRLRLVRQLVFEGILVATAAGVVGTLVSMTLLDASRGVIARYLGRTAPGGLEGVAIDGAVLGGTLAVVLTLGVLFGLLPAIVALRGEGEGILKGRRSTIGPSNRRARARQAMVVGEVALSLSLLIGAGLLVRSAWNLQSRDVGFRAEGVVAAEVGLRATRYPTAEDQERFFGRLLDEVEALPSVEAVALMRAGPFVDRPARTPVEAEGVTELTEAVFNVASTGAFDALGIRLVRGRTFVAEDGAGSEAVAVVTETVARSLWPGEDPLGRGIRMRPPQLGQEVEDPGPFLRVVGVVADVDYDATPGEVGTVWVPFAQSPRLWMSVFVRTDGRELRVVPEVEAVLQALDPEVPLSGTASVAAVVDTARAPTRFLGALFTLFAGFALALAVVGLFGVVSYAAQQRRREVAIRTALGADRAEIFRTFLLSGLALACGGVVLGLGGGRLVGGLLEGQLYGVGPSDPVTLGALGAALLVTAAIAVWIPARRAAGSSPMGVLREE